ncbi:hypothetical protein COHA_001407 [Chlorella ohadii]|uniref:RRM domain-containing protein n=1 Tax=Chlorella ohadii TaxID=2649997 RepID=A0AAD5DZ88_9CHLO|nr:hypothetical protein COHA_001407 [Chlorella ohadii]
MSEHEGGQPPLPEEAPPLPGGENGAAEENGKEERERRSSRDRSRERRKRSRRERRPRERSQERYRPRRRSPTPPEVRAERERQAELEALDRDVRTVFAYNLSLKADEKDIFQFFIRAGPLNDIKIITDKTTGRSKGFAYVEFQRKEDVINALALTGQLINGQPVMVKMSEAEKNLAWEAAEQAKKQQRELGIMPGAAGGAPALPPGAVVGAVAEVPQGPARLALSNLPVQISEPDLQPIFEPFGPLDFVRLQRDATGQATGIGFVQYKLLSDATKAKENLNGLDIVGHQLQVAWTAVETPIEALVSAAIAPPPLPPGVAPGINPANLAALAGLVASEMGIVPGAMPGAMPGQMGAPVVASLPESLDEGVEAAGGVGGIKLTGQSRVALMSKLAANAGLDTSNVPQLPLPQAPQQPQIPAALAMEQGMLGPASPIPTQCLLLKNMFDPAEESEPNWDQEIGEDVRGECSKYGPVEHVYVDRNSRGFVYVKFSAVQSAAAAQKSLHGRWFAARQIAADFQFGPIYNQHFGL